MGERVPKQKEGAPKQEVDIESISTFEDFQAQATEIRDLIRKRNLLNNISDSLRRGKLQYAKELPEFKDLIELEEELLAGGASGAEISRYGDLYQRAYERKVKMVDEVEERLNSLFKSEGFKTPSGGWAGAYPGSRLYETASFLDTSKGLPSGAVDAILRDGFRLFQEEVDRARELRKTSESMSQFEGGFGEEYRSLRDNLETALQAKRLKVKLKATETAALKKGFKSAEKMGEKAEEGLELLKGRVGGENFKILMEMNRERR